MKITKNQVIGAAVIVVVLVAAFFWGGNYADNTPTSSLPAAEESAATDRLESLTPQSVPLTQDTAAQPAEASNDDEPTQPSAPPPEEEEADTTTPPADTDTETAPQTVEPQEPTEPPHDEPEEAAKPPQGTEAVTLQDKYSTDAVPAGMPGPVEPEDVVIGDTAYTCTLSVRCDTILDNLSMLDQNKVELVPAEGIILAPITVTFYEGESVFEVLRREMKKHKIHMEFTTTPIYNSAYIEGINNLYEFDCGELSGWMYKVNGWFPNYGCSRYQLQEGDIIEWVYTCDLGRDVGDDWMGG